MELHADKDTIKLAIRVVNEALGEYEIPQLEGAIALRAILNALAEQGLDVRSEANVAFKFEGDH